MLYQIERYTKMYCRCSKRHGSRVKMLYLFHYLLEAFPKMRLTFNDDMYDVLMMSVGVDGTGYFNGYIFDCLRFRQVN